MSGGDTHREREDDRRRDRRRKRSRSRSRSRGRDRRRHFRSRSRDRDTEKRRDRSRSRSRERRRPRSPQRSDDRDEGPSQRREVGNGQRPRDIHRAQEHDDAFKKTKNGPGPSQGVVVREPSAAEEMPNDANGDGTGTGNPEIALDAELTAEEIQMMVSMGIPFSFDTTQGKHIDDEKVNVGAVKVASTRRARQFMNRRGGFNRPLPAERTGEKVRGD